MNKQETEILERLAYLRLMGDQSAVAGMGFVLRRLAPDLMGRVKVFDSKTVTVSFGGHKVTPGPSQPVSFGVGTHKVPERVDPARRTLVVERGSENDGTRMVAVDVGDGMEVAIHQPAGIFLTGDRLPMREVAGLLGQDVVVVTWDEWDAALQARYDAGHEKGYGAGWDDCDEEQEHLYDA